MLTTPAMGDALPADYDSLTADEKLEALWSRVSAEPYPDGPLPSEPPSTWARRKLFTVSHDRVSFEHTSDVVPAGRTKLVHAHGTCACVTWKVDDAHGFTGVFARGGRGLLRFSDATGGPVFSPSFAIKFPVSGGPSLNFFALPYEPRSGRDRDPLSSVYANGSPPPKAAPAKAVAWAFQRTADALGGTRLYAVYLPLHELAERDLEGERVGDPEVPDRVELRATEQARAALADADDWRRKLEGLQPGTPLFDMSISPHREEKAKPYGTLVLDTEVVASRWGDERLWFQHHTGPTR